eukprot:scaffold222730_cov35-Tisochrysis_lutea.AAC.2
MPCHLRRKTIPGHAAAIISSAGSRGMPRSEHNWSIVCVPSHIFRQNACDWPSAPRVPRLEVRLVNSGSDDADSE